jgi:hypothetical protein
MNTINYYLEKLNAKSTDYGNLGDACELAVREFLTGREQAKVKSQGKKDAYFSYLENGKVKKLACEIKIGCGEIDNLEKSQIIFYAPEIDKNKPIENQIFVFSRQEWLDFLNGYDGRGKLIRVDSKRNHKHIQSFYSETRPKASKPIANYIWKTCLDKKTLAEWKMEKRG